MTEENKPTNTEEKTEQQAPPNNATQAESTQPSQQQQQQQPSQEQHNTETPPQSSDPTQGTPPVPQQSDQTPASTQTPTSTTTIPQLDLTALLGSITVPYQSDLNQPAYINRDISEEDQLRVSGKTAAFPDIPAVPNAQHATAIRCTAGEMEVTEMRVKIICQEKNIMALKMELKAAELQVEAKNKVDAKKTRLVELLDNKLQQVEKRNAKLLEMVEQMLKDKEGNTNRLKEATHNMQDLSARLIKSERQKAELMNANTELRKMLESLETKGSQIAKLAMEKVLKYKGANDQMQQELTELKDGAAAKGADTASRAAEAAARSEITAANEELWTKISQLQQQMTAALVKEGDTSSTVETLQQSIKATNEANTALGLTVEEARQKSGQGLTALSVENEQLRALIEDFDVVRREMEKKEEISSELLKEQKESVTAKDKEIGDLKEELQRLKGAIGQLIGAK